MLILSTILPWIIAMFLAALVAAYGARRLAQVKYTYENRAYGK